MSVLAAFAALLILLVVAALPTPSVAQDACADAYPTPGPERDDCYRTATARAGQSTTYPGPTSPGDGQPAPQPTVTVTLTVTPTLTITSTLGPTDTPGPTRTATATRQPLGSPTPSATSTLLGLESLICAPGAAVTIAGRAAPNTALLLFFNERPVGGALSRADGSYQIVLNVGRERPGAYPLTVRERDGLRLVRELACEVPGATLTPTVFVAPQPGAPPGVTLTPTVLVAPLPGATPPGATPTPPLRG